MSGATQRDLTGKGPFPESLWGKRNLTQERKVKVEGLERGHAPGNRPALLLLHNRVLSQNLHMSLSSPQVGKRPGGWQAVGDTAWLMVPEAGL